MIYMKKPNEKITLFFIFFIFCKPCLAAAETRTHLMHTSAVQYYLSDDETFSSNDARDKLSISPASTTTLYDMDNDGAKGLSLARGSDLSDPTKYHEWVSPTHSTEACISGPIQVEIYSALKDYKTSKSGALSVYLLAGC